MKPSLTIEPHKLGFWTRTLRDVQSISQEALASASNLDVRTIQRIERGVAVNSMTRRSLARGLGYEDNGIFDDPAFIATVDNILAEAANMKLAELCPDGVRIQAKPVMSGEELSHFADKASGVCLHADQYLSVEAKEVAASLFDFIRDLMELGSDASYTNRVGFDATLDDMRKSLEAEGVSLYSGFRSMKMRNNATEKDDLHFTLGYLAAVPSVSRLQELVVPRKVQLSL